MVFIRSCGCIVLFFNLNVVLIVAYTYFICVLLKLYKMETNVAETFRNGTALVTGSTGFVGKLLTEKLLRSCSMKCIAVLVRNKRGIDATQRLADIYETSLFDRLRKEKPDFVNCIMIIRGDIAEPSLGISNSDRDWLIENVNFVFHCAATIKFNESLKIATTLNVQGTENLLSLASEMKNLKGFVHVSTAYSNCTRNEIKEQFYPMAITANELKNRLKENEKYDDIDNWPNTYCYTKAMTETIILKNEFNLPISIFRPSIVGCTISEPNPGWLENLNGPSGIVTAVVTGILRVIPIKIDMITDIIPADYTVNTMICTMWDTVNRYQNSCQINEEPKIYNYVSSTESPVTWYKYIREVHQSYYGAPPLQSIWYCFYIFYTNFWVGVILRFLLHRIPATIMDLLLILSGKKSKMLKIYSKTDEMTVLLRKFTSTEWTFDNNNVKKLWSSLCQEDRQKFWFSMDKFNWDIYSKSFYFGIREHILHEDLSNTKEALAKCRKLYWAHNCCVALVIYLVLYICWTIMKFIF